MLKIKFRISGIQIELNVQYSYLLELKNIPFQYIPRKPLDNIAQSNEEKERQCRARKPLDRNPLLDSFSGTAYDVNIKQTVLCSKTNGAVRLGQSPPGTLKQHWVDIISKTFPLFFCTC